MKRTILLNWINSTQVFGTEQQKYTKKQNNRIESTKMNSAAMWYSHLGEHLRIRVDRELFREWVSREKWRIEGSEGE